MLKGFIAGLGGAALLIAALLVYRSYSVQCPCGFKYDGLTGGCVVDINAGPCTGNGGGPSSSHPGSGGSGTGTVQGPANPNFPPSCIIQVANCVVRPDWKGIDFTLFYGGSTVSPGTKMPVNLTISQRDRNGKSCARIKGGIEARLNTPTTIPFDANALSTNFPVATTSASGPPTNGLVSQIHDPCNGTLTEMIIFPTRDAQCGCKTSFKRD
jgi:hypothetical protein